MHKTILRPLRLVHLNKHLSHKLASMVEESNGSEVQDEDEAAMPHNTLPSFPDQSFQGGFPAWSTIQEDNNCMATSITDRTNKDHIPASEVEAQHLLQRTPNSYMLNQAYGMWFFISWFFLTVIITRKVSTNDYGTFAIALAAFNTVAYIVALGLEDAATTYIPKILSEHGQAAAASLIRRLLALRTATLVISVAIMLFGLPILATLISLIPIQGSADNAASLRNPSL